jgi:hypothetical protein
MFVERYETRTVGSLQVGEIVGAHGMRLLVTDAPTLGTHAGGRTYWTRALVLNRDDPQTDAVPHGWTAQPDGSHRWALQGNDLGTVGVLVYGPHLPNAPHAARMLQDIGWDIRSNRRGDGWSASGQLLTDDDVVTCWRNEQVLAS